MPALKSPISDLKSPPTADPVVVHMPLTLPELQACARAGFGWPLPQPLTERFIDALTLLAPKHEPSQILNLQSEIHTS
jgi:hypothetical protein